MPLHIFWTWTALFMSVRVIGCCWELDIMWLLQVNTYTSSCKRLFFPQIDFFVFCFFFSFVVSDLLAQQ